MEVFYANSEQITKNKIFFSEDESNHIKNAKRYKVGDTVSVVDGNGNFYTAKLEYMDKKRLAGVIISKKQSDIEPLLNVHLAQALPKGKKFDDVVDSCTQIGVKKFIPFVSERTIVKYDYIKKQNLINRWYNIAIGAMKLSGSAYLPKFTQITDFNDVLSMTKDYDLCLFASAFEGDTAIKTVLQKKQNRANFRNILAIIGPEGGFSQREVQLAREAGCKIISLGKPILKTQIAGLVMCSIIFYELG